MYKNIKYYFILLLINSFCNANANENLFENLRIELNEIGLQLTNVEQIYNGKKINDYSVDFAKNLQKKIPEINIKKYQNDVFYEIEITHPKIESKIIVIMPITANKHTVINFILDGGFVNDFILKYSAIKKDNGSARFFHNIATDNMINIAIMAKAKNKPFFKDGLMLNSKEEIEKTQRYAYFLPAMETIIEVFFPDVKNVYLNGMSLGFIKTSLALSQSFNDHNMIPSVLKFLSRLGFIVNWSGAPVIEIDYCGTIFKPLFIAINAFLTDVESKKELFLFKENINIVLQNKNNVEKIISIADQKWIEKLRKLLNKEPNPDKILARMLLLPPIISVYNNKDMILNGLEAMEYISKQNGLLDMFYSDFPEYIKNSYKTVIMKYSSLAIDSEYTSNGLEFADYINHNPDYNQLLNIFELQFKKNKYSLLEEILLLSQ